MGNSKIFKLFSRMYFSTGLTTMVLGGESGASSWLTEKSVIGFMFFALINKLFSLMYT